MRENNYVANLFLLIKTDFKCKQIQKQRESFRKLHEAGE